MAKGGGRYPGAGGRVYHRFFAIVRELMGVEEGLVSFYTNPEIIRRMLRDHCDFASDSSAALGKDQD